MSRSGNTEKSRNWAKNGSSTNAWRSITDEHPPRMTHALLWFPRSEHVIALIGDWPYYECIGYLGDEQPTHWMPLPAPPEAPDVG